MSGAEARQLARSQQLELWYDDLWQIVKRRMAARRKRFAGKPGPTEVSTGPPGSGADATGRELP
jgi:hypothetical protein